jgi:hypothetical protein
MAGFVPVQPDKKRKQGRYRRSDMVVMRRAAADVVILLDVGATHAHLVLIVLNVH